MVTKWEEEFTLNFEKGVPPKIDDLARVVNDATQALIDAFHRAETEAIRNNIKTNAILLNSEFNLTKTFYYAFGYNQIAEVPPMILGKAIYLDTDKILPEDTAFALFEARSEPKYDLQRFLNMDISDAKEELREGKKRTCWIWYVFPQLESLGHSEDSIYFGIKNIEEAKEFLKDSILSERITTCCELLLEHATVPIEEIMGSHLDATKLCSSMTLFYLASDSDDNIFGKVLDTFYQGAMDYLTLKHFRGK